MLMDISVIMSVYNTNIQYLKESIDSILNQTYRKYELIIIDDGSQSEEIKEILEQYQKKDRRVEIITNDSNYGLTKSLNIALEMAVGKYIVRMDSDDISYSERLEKQFLYMENHPEVTVLGSKVIKFGEKQKNEPMYYIDYIRQSYEKFLINMMFYNVGPIHPTVMMRKSFLDEFNIRYDEEIIKAQDYKLWIDCIACGGIFYNLPQVLLNYRIHENQITSRNHNEQYFFIQNISKLAIKRNGFMLEEEELEVLTTFYSDIFEAPVKKYIDIIKKMVAQNSQMKIYNKKIFAETINERWIHKVIKCCCKDRDFRGLLCFYTWKCVFSKSMIFWMKNHLFSG